MIATSPTNADWWMLIAIGLLLIVLVVFSIAEMGLSRMSKPKAQALADSGTKGGASLLSLVKNPERWVNPLLLSVNVCQTVQATLTGVVAGRLFGAQRCRLFCFCRSGAEDIRSDSFRPRGALDGTTHFCTGYVLASSHDVKGFDWAHQCCCERQGSGARTIYW
jgi:hypothetical protein